MSGNGSTGRMLDLMGHAVARLDDLVDGQRHTNRRLDQMAERQDQMAERQDQMAERLDQIAGRLDHVAGDLEETKLHVAGIEGELHRVNERLDSAHVADRSIRDRLTALEGWAARQGYEGADPSAR